jgi:hypothetical protein
MSGIYDYQVKISNPGLASYVVEDLVPGKWYFALSAYDSNGIQSTRSNEVAKTLD